MTLLISPLLLILLPYLATATVAIFLPQIWLWIHIAAVGSGTLWEGRFRSCLTQTKDYVLACYRYIELNPVRAAMVNQPQDYRWSSYHTNALGKAGSLIVPHDQYLRLGRDQTA